MVPPNHGTLPDRGPGTTSRHPRRRGGERGSSSACPRVRDGAGADDPRRRPVEVRLGNRCSSLHDPSRHVSRSDVASRSAKRRLAARHCRGAQLRPALRPCRRRSVDAYNRRCRAGGGGPSADVRPGTCRRRAGLDRSRPTTRRYDHRRPDRRQSPRATPDGSRLAMAFFPDTPFDRISWVTELGDQPLRDSEVAFCDFPD